MLPAKRPTWLPLSLAFVALTLVFAEGAAAKCTPGATWPGLEPGVPVVLVDGSIAATRLRDGERILEEEEIDPSTIHSLEVTCWNPRTGEIGGGVGLNVIAIWTNSLAETTRAPIDALLRAQTAYFSQHSRYVQSLDELRGFGIPEDAMLEFSATPTGWSATTPRDDVDYRCFVYSGSAVPAVFGMKEREVVCQPETARVSRALREMYEGSG
jgi:hypothetical protein